MTPNVSPRDHAVYVEDDQANRSLMASIFARHFPNIQLTLASNGSAGLDAVDDLAPHLVLLDGYLGDMTASEFVSTMRSRLQSAMPLIVVVSGSMPSDSATAIEGVLAHVMKPYKIAQLVELIGRLLDADDHPHHDP
jgi:CheY-like chemotaxis protein